MSIENRKEQAKSDLAKRLFEIMIKKKSNLCLAADVKSSQELFALAEKIGPHICCLKTHVDALSDWHNDSTENAEKLILCVVSRQFCFLLRS